MPTASESSAIGHAAIVAGGLGTRARSLTGTGIPKALLPVAGVPIIVRQLRALQREGVRRITILAGYLGESLHPALAPEADRLGLDLDIVVEDKLRGTAGCLVGLGAVVDPVLIVSGDMLFDIDLNALAAFHREHGAVITIIAHPNDHPQESDLLVATDGIVSRVLSKSGRPPGDYRNLVPAGLYLASPAFFAALPRDAVADMIRDALPAVIADGARVAAYQTPEYLRDVGTVKGHATAERDIAVGRPELMRRDHPRPALFVDCDGVLNEEPGEPGVVRPDQVAAISGAGAALRRVNEAGLLAVAVTNRPQIAKGFIGFADLDRIFGRLETLLARDGGLLDRIYFCPHHPEAGFAGEVPALKIRCECRKPGALMLTRALAELPIETRRSSMVGDSLRDIGAARAAGIWAYGVRTGYGCRDGDRYPGGRDAAPHPDQMFEDLAEAVTFILGYPAIAAPVVEAVNVSARTPQRPFVVAICGHSRAGKSSLAHAVERVLDEAGGRPLRVGLDQWILPEAERGANSLAEARNRVEVYRRILSDLRAGKTVTAPGYDAATRGAGREVVYDPKGRAVILLEGVFAAHETIRDLIDLAVFVEADERLLERRFGAFYRWKGMGLPDIETLWRQRSTSEGSAVDTQRRHADLVVPSAAAQ